MNGWLQIEGVLYALAARRGDEAGSYLWISAGELDEAITAELFMPAVDPQLLDGAMGVAVGTVQPAAGQRCGNVAIQFGRVRGGRGVLSAAGQILEADIRFELRHHPPDGGFCALCGAELEIDPVEVITPPDGGLIGVPVTRCPRCAM